MCDFKRQNSVIILYNRGIVEMLCWLFNWQLVIGNKSVDIIVSIDTYIYGYMKTFSSMSEICCIEGKVCVVVWS